MTKRVKLAQQQLQTSLLESGSEIPEIKMTCQNASKAHSIRKYERLQALAKLVLLAQKLVSMDVLTTLNSWYSTKTEYKFSFFSTRKNLQLSAPHYTQKLLF